MGEWSARQFLQYERHRAKDAWDQTVKHLGAELVIVLLLALAGLLWQHPWHQPGRGSELHKTMTWVAVTLGPIGLVFLGAFAVHWLTAPSRLAHEASVGHQTSLRQAQEAHQAALEDAQGAHRATSEAHRAALDEIERLRADPIPPEHLEQVRGILKSLMRSMMDGKRCNYMYDGSLLSYDPRCRTAIEVHCGEELIRRCDDWDKALGQVEHAIAVLESRVDVLVAEQFSDDPWVTSQISELVKGRLRRWAQDPDTESRLFVRRGMGGASFLGLCDGFQVMRKEGLTDEEAEAADVWLAGFLLTASEEPEAQLLRVTYRSRDLAGNAGVLALAAMMQPVSIPKRGGCPLCSASLVPAPCRSATLPGHSPESASTHRPTPCSSCSATRTRRSTGGGACG